MPCVEPTSGQMTSAAVWQMSSKEPNWTPMAEERETDKESGREG